MRQIELSGTYREMGEAYGEKIAAQNLNWWWKEPSPRKLSLTKACEQEIAKHAPGFLEEIQAIAAVCNTDYYIVLSNMTVAYFVEMACNCVAVSGSNCANGQAVVARNHDWLDADAKSVTRFTTSPSNGLRSIGFGFTDPGRYDGINEAGLAIASSSIPGYAGSLQPGFRMNVAQRWVLDTCDSVPAAIDYLKAISHQEGMAYLVADKEGRVARIEVAPEGIDVVETDQGMVSTVNTFQATSLRPYDNMPENDICHEYKQRIARWYEAGKGHIDVGLAKQLCSDHVDGICEHGEGWDNPGGTIYSWVAALGTNELELAHGRPCETPYEHIQLQVGD